jgi:hypothetical protein
MTPVSRRWVLPACAFLVAGCAAPQLLAPLPDPRPHYGLLATNNPRATVTSVVASSTRNNFFRPAYAVDGNFHSAWSPSATDPHPSLLIGLAPFNLGAGSIVVKASHVSGSTAPILVHFDIKNVGQPFFDFGGFQVTPGIPGFLNISQTPIATVEQVRATFNTSDLLVCEVQFFANHQPSLP